MKGKNIAIVFLSIIVLVVLWLFIDERQKAKRKDEIIDRLKDENRRIKMAYLSLLENFLKQTGEVEPNVIEELHRLKSKIDQMDTAIHIELDSVIKKVTEGEGTKAVKDLAKIVENVLKEVAVRDATFTKTPMLHNLLEYAKGKGLICSRLYENGMKLKEIRNKESHELAPACSKLEIGMSVFAGIEIISAITSD
jgi:hypothetical protein